MSDRRRTLFILLLVLGLIAASAVVVATKETKLGLDLQGGVQLVYEGEPTPQQPEVTQEALDRALQIMRDRVDAFGVAEPELQLLGREQIEVNLPGVENADRAANQVGSTAQLFFYDWEANILDEDCRTNPDERNGGQQAITGLYQAVKQASTCDPEVDRNNVAAAEPRFYAFDKVSKRPFANAQAIGVPGRRRSRSSAPRRRSAPRSSRFRPASSSSATRRRSRARTARSRPSPTAGGSSRTTRRSRAPTSRTPSRTSTSGTGGDPIVTFKFTDKGRKAFQTITRRIAQRGADNALPGTNAQNASQHFAIVLDDELVSRAVHQLPGEPGRHRRLDRRADLRRLHDPVGPGPGEDPPDRRAADQARADLALAGVGQPRRPGAGPGPDRGHRRLRRSSRSS